ncbi:MAG: 30S ribosomal protein S12 methylthiotransferase RimO [Acidimicrobiia bacterium]
METLGCPKNAVDSDKLAGRLEADGYVRAHAPEEADLVVVNTCAFVEAARQESIDAILALASARKPGAALVVTGCLAERYGDELAAALPEVDRVAGFGVPVDIRTPTHSRFDLLELPRPKARSPWAYVKVAEGCDRACGYCAIPMFRGPQRSRPMEVILAEVEALGAAEVVLVAQDLARYGLDQGRGERRIVELVQKVAAMVPRVRLLYLHPADLTDELIDAICSTGVAYFDLSLQHVSRPLLRRMRRFGDGATFLRRIAEIRRREPEAVFRSNFIVGYPGETEADHDALLAFLEEAQLDWCGLFAYSPEEGTYATTLDGQVPPPLVTERLRELSEVVDRITAERRAALVGREVEVLVDEPGVGRTWREAPEIDGVVQVPATLPVGSFTRVTVTGAAGPDLEAC